VRSAASSLPHGRVAIVVPRFDRTAAARNVVKRRLRELVRRELLPTLPALDVVLRASPACYQAKFGALLEAVRDLAPQLSVRP
jgi:ribonuclease P protein component